MMKKLTVLLLLVCLCTISVFAQPVESPAEPVQPATDAVVNEAPADVEPDSAVATPSPTAVVENTPAAVTSKPAAVAEPATVAATPSPTPTVIGENGTTVTILFTSDIHGHFQQNATSGTLGYSGIAAIQRSIPGSILVDGGDYLTSNLFTTEETISDVLSLMNAAGYRVAGIGEADLENGIEPLRKVQTEAGFHMLSSNISYAKERMPLLGDTIILDVNGINVGFFSILNPDLRLDASLQNLEDVYLEDAARTAQKCVNKLKAEGADVIIALSHVGNEGNTTIDQVTAFVNGIDFVLDGHDHVEETGRWIGDTLILNPGFNGKQAIELTINFDAYRKITNLSTTQWSYEGILNLPQDEAVVALENEIAHRQSEILGADIARAETTIPYSYSMLYQSDPLGNFVADAYRQKTMATVAMVNAGSIEASIPEGEITKATILAVLPNQYTVQVKNVTPKMLRTALEGCLYHIELREDGTIDPATATTEFPQISGFTVQVNFNNEPGKRVMGIRLDNGVELNLADSYTSISLASSSGVFSGELGFDAFLEREVEEDYGSEGQALLEHLTHTENPEEYSSPRIILTNQQESYTGLIVSILLIITLVVMVLIFIIKLMAKVS